MSADDQEIEASFKTVGKAVLSAVQDAGGFFSPGDLAFGLRYLYADIERKIIADLPKSPPTDLPQSPVDRLAIVDKWMKWVQATYQPTLRESIEKILGKKYPIAVEARFLPTFLENTFKSSLMVPAHFLALDPSSSSIVLGIRGTSSLSDALTDITASYLPYKEGFVHVGMFRSAKALFKKYHPVIEYFVNTGWNIVCLGHSLGAGTASLVSMLFTDVWPGKVTCIGVATPSVCTKDLSDAASEYITTMVYNDDIVPRASSTTLGILQKDLSELNWKSLMKADISASASATYKSFETAMDNYLSPSTASTIKSGLSTGFTGAKRGAKFLKRATKTAVETVHSAASSVTGSTSTSLSIEEEAQLDSDVTDEKIVEKPNVILLPAGHVVHVYETRWTDVPLEKLKLCKTITCCENSNCSNFDRINFTHSMTSDHFLASYQKALDTVYGRETVSLDSTESSKSESESTSTTK